MDDGVEQPWQWEPEEKQAGEVGQGAVECGEEALEGDYLRLEEDDNLGSSGQITGPGNYVKKSGDLGNLGQFPDSFVF